MSAEHFISGFYMYICTSAFSIIFHNNPKNLGESPTEALLTNAKLPKGRGTMPNLVN